MKKYDLSAIMKRAWELVKAFGMSISESLKLAWKEAKEMTNNSIITVKEWFFDKLWNAMSSYNMLPECQYTEVNGIRMADHTKLHINEVLAESEKAIKVTIDAETFAGNHKTYTTWIPKSVIC